MAAVTHSLWVKKAAPMVDVTELLNVPLAYRTTMDVFPTPIKVTTLTQTLSSECMTQWPRHEHISRLDIQ
jgi:hypothetical protein